MHRGFIVPVLLVAALIPTFLYQEATLSHSTAMESSLTMQEVVPAPLMPAFDPLWMVLGIVGAGYGSYFVLRAPRRMLD